MTEAELAAELAKLEGVEQIFAAMVTEMVAASRKASMQKMLGAPGRAPSLVAKEAATLEGALEKIEHNLRCQYDDFVAAYAATRARLLTPEQLQRFITALRDDGVQEYLVAMRTHQKALVEATQGVLKQMMSKAVQGPRPEAVAARA